MKLYNSVGPNPKVVRMFMAERGIEMDTVEVDLMKGENRQAAHMKRNPSGQCPALELDDGSFIAEIIPICEYLDEKAGSSSLVGTTPEERAETRMWMRRIDLQILEPLANGFRFSEGLPIFKDRVRTIPHAADDLKTLAQERLTWLDEQMSGKQYICGDRFTLADILLFVFLEFGGQVGQPLNTGNKNIAAWYDRVKERASASA
ncbi:MAG: glutathione S-transferase [Pseudomonadales bacterium]|nr:glutathione S-transferase [Pseudomonadales bacterium]